MTNEVEILYRNTKALLICG